MNDGEMDSQTVDIKTALTKYCDELSRLKEMQELAVGYGTQPSKRPEDKAIYPLLVSCKQLADEVLFAVNQGFGRAALRTVRTMYECVVTARYINLHPDKADDFLSSFYAQWAKIVQWGMTVQNIPEESRTGSMHEELVKQVPKYANKQYVNRNDLDWSGARILKMAKEAGSLAELHSSAFDYASAFVHPTALFVLPSMSSPGGGFQVGVRSQDHQARLAIKIAHDLILNVADLRLMYSPSDKLRESFNLSRSNFVRIWGYPPHL